MSVEIAMRIGNLLAAKLQAHRPDRYVVNTLANGGTVTLSVAWPCGDGETVELRKHYALDGLSGLQGREQQEADRLCGIVQRADQ